MLLECVQASSIAFAIAFGVSSFTMYIRMAVYTLLQFLAGGFIVSTSLCYIANNYMKVTGLPHRYVLPAMCALIA